MPVQEGHDESADKGQDRHAKQRSVLGIEVQGDHGALFGMAVLTFVSAFVVTFLHRHEIPSYTPMTPY